MGEPNASTPVTLSRVIVCVAVGVGLMAAAHLLDRWAFETLRIDERRLARRDWAALLKAMGYAPLWLGVALLMVRDDWRRFATERPAWLIDRWSRGALLVSAVAAAGLAAEGLKLASRRLRPGDEGGWAGYAFDWPAGELWSSSGIGLASSHTAVAFGAALMMSKLHPRYRHMLLALAAGCGWQRVASGAHYLSDVAAAAIIAWLVVQGLWRAHWALLRRRAARRGPSAL